jgi:hypothetical protein
MIKEYLVFLVAIGMFWSAVAHFGFELHSPESIAELFHTALENAMKGIK